jgi:hypothetical protein
MLNFISNYIRAQRNFGRTTSAEMLEKKLLRGVYFEGVRIDRSSLEDIHCLFRADRFGDGPYFRPAAPVSNETPNEREILEEEKRRLERAQNRLKSLYLYSDDSISESEYLSECLQLTEKLSKVNSRLSELDASKNDDGSPDDDTFMEQASYLVITEELLSKRYVDYEKVIRVLDKRTLKLFINSLCKKIVILQGKIMEIDLKNGIVIKFLYE